MRPFNQYELPTPPPAELPLTVSDKGMILSEGQFTSPNFVTGQKGWMIDSEGNAQFNAGIAVDSLDIPDNTTANSFHVDTSGNTWWGSTTISGSTASVSAAGVASFTNVLLIDGTITKSFTVGEDLFANDFVYPSGTDIVERIRPISFNTPDTSITAPGAEGNIPKILKIDATRTLHVLGGRTGTSLVLKAYIGTINANEDDFTYGSAYAFGAVNSYSFDVCQFDTTKFLVIYQQGSGSAAGIKAAVLDVGSSGSTITAGTIKVIETTGHISNQVACTALDTGRVLAIHTKDSTSLLSAQVLSISGTTITLNTVHAVGASATSQKYAQVSKIDTDKAIVVYNDDGSDPLNAKVLTISSTTITVNGINTLDADATNYYTISTMGVISATKVAFTFVSVYNTNTYAAILTISGTTVTMGTPLEISSTDSFANNYANVVVVSPSVLLTGVCPSNTSMLLKMLYVDGTTITETTSVECNDGGNFTYTGSWVCKTKPFKYVIIMGTDYSTVTLGSNSNKNIGIAIANISDTLTGLVALRYTVNSMFSGLTAGTIYYIDDSGRLTSESSTLSVVAGIALNTTDLLLQ